MAAIGIMGGTFNPIHIGHIKIAQAASEQYHLDEVWFMPNHIPGYKSNDALVSGRHRFAMCQCAISDISNFRVSDYEMKQSGNTYTSKTFQGLCSKYPEHTFYFIMGADSLDYFDKWKDPDLIVQYATILVAPRDNEGMDALQKQIDKANQEFGVKKFFPVICEMVPCSSHEIREAFFNEEITSSKFQGFLPDTVYAYIMKYGLYQRKSR